MRFKLKNAIYGLFFILCLCIIASTTTTKLVTGNASLFGYRIHHVQSKSMEPTIHAGQLIIGKTIRPNEVQIGDIIIYKTGSHWYDTAIAHRVVCLSADSFILQGDNRQTNPKPDAPVSAEQIVEKVIWY